MPASDRKGADLAGAHAAKRVLDRSPGPWASWRGTRAGRYVRFIEKYCRSPKGVGWGKPLRLASWQKEEIEEWTADDVDAAVESFPRGNGKSVLEAAFGTAAGFMDDETGAPQVPVVATTVGQAMRSVYDNMVSMVRHEPELADRSLIFTGIGSSRIVIPSNEGVIFPVSNEEAGLQGLDPSTALVDEIGFQPISAWSAVRQAAGKRPRSLVLGMGTPGVDVENALYAIRDRALSTGIHRLYFREWAAEEGCDAADRVEWHRANPALVSGFLRLSALESDYDEWAGGARFRIFRLGQWVEGYESWLGEDGYRVWRNALQPYELVPNVATWVGVDAAISRDTTAVVAVQVREDNGLLHAVAKFWEPTRDEPTDIADVMAYIRQLADTYKVGAVAYDPRFMDWPAKQLHDEGIPMVEIPQGPERMTGIIGDLYTLIRDGGLTHDDDRTFERHILDAQARQNERGFTLSKGKSRGHIDGAIALALAVDRYRGKKKPRQPLFIG